MTFVPIIAARKIYINREIQPGETVEVPPKLAAALIALGRAIPADQPPPFSPSDPPENPETATAAPDRRRKRKE